jgi:oxaloacetate decarboxylase beta subunit
MGNFIANLLSYVNDTGFLNIYWGNIVMFVVGGILLYLAIVKEYEPLLLIPIGFGSILANMPLGQLGIDDQGGLIFYLYKGVAWGFFPPLIFMGVGALTDFGPMLSNPKTMLLGAAAQFGIFVTIIGAVFLGFNMQEAASIGIIGGADGPTAIFLASKMAPHLLGAIAVSAYSYMALVPIIQPPIMKLLTSKSEREIRMKQLRPVPKTERIIFPCVAFLITGLIAPAASPLLGMLMFGNLMRESKVVDRLSRTASDSLNSIVVIFLGISVGASTRAETFLTPDSLKILALGAFSFAFATATGVIFAKLMNFFSKDKINPLIGAAGVSAVPDSARVVQVVGRNADPNNFLLMHAMGPNVSGTIGSAIAAGILLSILG